MTTTLYQTDYASTTLTFGTALNTVANGGYSVPSGLVNNTYSNGSQKQSATLVLTFGTPLTAGSGTPSIVLYPILSVDGTTYPTPPGNAASAPRPNARSLTAQVVASASFSQIQWENFDISDPGWWAFMFLNNSGVTWSGTITATLKRFTAQFV